MVTPEERAIAAKYLGWLALRKLEREAGIEFDDPEVPQDEHDGPDDDQEEVEEIDQDVALEIAKQKIEPDRYFLAEQTASLIGCTRNSFAAWRNAEFFPSGEMRGDREMWRGELIIEWLDWRSSWDGTDLRSYKKALKEERCTPFDNL